jgi:deoxyribodipyrimidine photo-lyase
LNGEAIRPGGGYVLYWSQMNRRVDANHALAHAAKQADEFGLPALVYEGLTCTYPYANDRLHTFILEGVEETERRLKELGIGYIFYLRRCKADPDDILYRLAKDAAAVVTDDFPTFVNRRHNESVPGKLDVRMDVVDSSCIVPMNCLEKREWAAYTIRPKIKRLLPEYLRPAPRIAVRQPYRAKRSPFHTPVTAAAISQLVASCEIDHSVPPSVGFGGGRRAAEEQLQRFLEDRLRRYAGGRNEPSAHATSDLSPWLHFGRISSLEVALAAREYAEAHKLIADEFLEELIVRRELAFNFTRFTDDYESLDSLPDWSKQTMAVHRKDRRDAVYSREQFEHGATHDDLWNATEKELLVRGKIHGYYRMYWGKKIIEWSADYESALATMIYLHDRYALDGRDPNTYTNILWCFGLHDRPWFERPVFGTIRYMSLGGMERKTNVRAYIEEIEALEREGREPEQAELFR